MLNHLGFWPTGFHADEHGRPRFDDAYTAGGLDAVAGLARFPRVYVLCTGMYAFAARAVPLRRPASGRRAGCSTRSARSACCSAPTSRGSARRPGYARDARRGRLAARRPRRGRAGARPRRERAGALLVNGELYRAMLTIRRFEERVVDLVNANEIAGVTHEYVGQEAVAVGVCAALRADDVITSTHRGHGHLIAKGADVAAHDGGAARPRRRAEPRAAAARCTSPTSASASTAPTASSPPARRSPPAPPGRSRSTARAASRSRSSATAARTRACCTRR